MSEVQGHELQALVTHVWREVLDAAHGDPNEDFFDLGGDSLLGRRITTSLSRALGRRIPLEILFDAPTLGGLLDTLRLCLSSYDDFLEPLIPRLPRRTNLSNPPEPPFRPN